MLSATVVVLFVLWVIGMTTGTTLAGLIHLLLVGAAVLFMIRMGQGDWLFGAQAREDQARLPARRRFADKRGPFQSSPLPDVATLALSSARLRRPGPLAWR